jgi:hypothetical protein
MEYRAWISVPGLPLEAEQRWEPLIERLEREHHDYGPILAWEADGAQVVLSTDAPSEAIAARDLYHAVAESLRATGLSELYPTRVAIVPVSADQITPAAA